MNKYAIYKGRAITHVEFVALCSSIGINGGRMTTYREVLERMAQNGNERAQQLVANLQFIDDK